MNQTVISRRGALSVLALTTLSLAVPSIVLTVSNAEAQQAGAPTGEQRIAQASPPLTPPPTVQPGMQPVPQTGTERRQARRTGRVKRRAGRREARRKGRADRREAR